MAEECSVYELEGLQTQLQSLLSRDTSEELRADSKPFCSDFCKLVEEHASRWQVPLPQLRVLERALCCFAQASTFFASNCDHVNNTLSSLALSIFELLLFFDRRDFHQEPLKHVTVVFQECYVVLARHQNVHLLQVQRLIQGGGPWAGPVLQAILSESSLPQNEADGAIGSELPVFFELRVRYLLSCERVGEAVALAKRCARHPTAGRHLFFLQVYLTWLYKTSQHDRLHKEADDLNGQDAVHIICNLECEEKDDLLLALSRAFLSQQLRRGDMCYLCDLVFIWGKLHSRVNTPKQALLEEIHQLMLSATNVNSIFPFIRAILQELGEDGIQFCVELCANALESCLPCDVVTKSLIYKTIAGLLPNDQEVCRACALLVFFLERDVEAYKMVYLLYMHPDQEYHVEHSPIGNHVRFETLQVLKKDLYFDPEFWNLIALRTNCLKLMSEKVVSAALEEIMEDKWIHNYCTKEPALLSRKSLCQKRAKGVLHAAAKKRHHKEDADTAPKRLKVSPGKTRLNADLTVKKKGAQGSRPLREASSEPLRRSFWQLDRIQDNVAVRYGEHRRTTRLSEKNPPKRRIRKPKWLAADSGTLEENSAPSKMRRHQKQHRPSGVKRPDAAQSRGNAKDKAPADSHFKANENDKHQRGFSLDCLKPAASPQVILELSLPDNELLGTFSEDSCSRQRGLPQVLLYKPTVKLPAASHPAKTVHRKEVILRARDANMFVKQLHCYAQRQKGKGNGSIVHGSVSTITRSSVQGSPPKDPRRELKRRTASAADVAASPVSVRALQAQAPKAASRKTSEKSAAGPQTPATEAPASNKVLQAQTAAEARELCEEPAVEMKVTIASQAPAAGKASQSPGLDQISKAQSAEDPSKTTSPAEASHTAAADRNPRAVADEIPPASTGPNAGAAHPTPSHSHRIVPEDAEREPLSLRPQAEIAAARAKAETPEALASVDAAEAGDEDLPKVPGGHAPCEKDLAVNTAALNKTQATYSPVNRDSVNDLSALTLVTEMVTELAPEALRGDGENGAPAQPTAGSKPRAVRTTSGCSAPERRAADAQPRKWDEGTQDIAPGSPENSELADAPPESEESKLEYCCTLCNKLFKGGSVVTHAMFHYRKDQCMFCGTMFKDDLLAMIHLSDHIEKLKKSRESAGSKVQDDHVSETKGVSAAQTSTKAKIANMSSGRRNSGRLKKFAACAKPGSLQDPGPPDSRKLRSKDKPRDGQLFQEKKQNASKHLHGDAVLHKVNGHVGKKKKKERALPEQESLRGAKNPRSDGPELSENSETESSELGRSAEEETGEEEPPRASRPAAKQTGKSVEEKGAGPGEKVRCPVDGCAWFTDLSKNRVALLYHALEDHHGQPRPLELAFRVGNSKCSICARVLWSFEHFRHHVESHRVTPRYPCPHQGCGARFKTGTEMRRHARRHSPLQAACCLPGCSKLFICLWALNLHEREHYASRPVQPGELASGPAADGRRDEADARKPPPKDRAASGRAARRIRATHESPSSSGKRLKASASKERNRTKDSDVLKNLSNKDTSAQSAVPHLRVRRSLRKALNKTLASTKIYRVISSSLLKHKSRARREFKREQAKASARRPTRRGRPPKSKKAVRDENASAGQSGKPVEEDAAPRKDQPKSSPAAATSNVSRVGTEGEKSERGRDVGGAAETSADESTCRELAVELVHQKGVSQTGNGPNQPTSAALADESQASTPDIMKSAPRVKKCSAPKERRSRAASLDPSESKKHKAANDRQTAPAAAPQDAARAAAAVEVKSSADEDGKAKADAERSAQNAAGDPESPNEAKEEKAGASHVAKKAKHGEKNAKAASSGEAEKKRRAGDKKSAKEKRRRGEPGRTPASKKTAKDKSVVRQQDETNAALGASALHEEGKSEEAAPGATLLSSGPSVPALSTTSSEKTSPPAATEENAQEATAGGKSDDCGETKNSGDAKMKRCEDGAAPSASEQPAETKTEVQQPVGAERGDSSAGEVGKALPEAPQPAATSGRGCAIANGQAAGEDLRACRDTLAEYGRKPYVRPPPTAYLDEKYITMPKRRKEMALFPASARAPLPGQACAAPAPQRQRCANCFATFNSGEELQGHLRLDKCSNPFGFDSDDEGNS